jgi:hypothetical protein
MAPYVSRRGFFKASIAVGAAALSTACPRPQQMSYAEVFKRSGRGRRISNAAKQHNANRMYKSFEAALFDPAHPGDRSKVVSCFISRDRFDDLFPGNRTVTDLRQV